MIKPVTFQGISNFKANLYALEVKSRFIDQANANGYYKNYGSELAAVVIGETIQVGTGAFVVQGRMSEITIAEIVTPSIVNGNVGYVCLRCETYHPSDEYNTRLVVYTAATLNEIELTQEDTYQNGADETNKIYELPIYSFAISNGAITNLTKLIEPCGDYEKLKAIADAAVAAAQNAVETANNANTQSQNAVETANNADSQSQTAINTANAATQTAQQASTDVSRLEGVVDEFVDRIIDKQGTRVVKGDTSLTTLEVADTPKVDAAALYDNKGNIKSSKPLADNDCVRLIDLENLLCGGGFDTSIYIDDNHTPLLDNNNNAVIANLKI